MANVQLLGDVIGAVFADEEEAVLFIPNAGDIMICRAEDWLNLTNGTCPRFPAEVAANQDTKMDRSSETPSDLRSALIHLGANLG